MLDLGSLWDFPAAMFDDRHRKPCGLDDSETGNVVAPVVAAKREWIYPDWLVYILEQRTTIFFIYVSVYINISPHFFYTACRYVS